MKQQTKGVAVVVARKLINQKGPAAKQQLLSKLTADERNHFLKALDITWMPLATATSIYIKAGKLLFPRHPNPGYELLRVSALDNGKNIYKIFFKLLSTPIIARNAAKLWERYHNQGKARVDIINDHEIEFVVENYPDLPLKFVELLSGYVHGMVELGGESDVKVRPIMENPQKWRWHASWKKHSAHQAEEKQVAALHH